MCTVQSENFNVLLNKYIYSASVGENKKDFDDIKMHGTTMKITNTYLLVRFKN
jgi:hypothetical protein